MKTLNIPFNDRQFKKIRKAKEISDAKTWREWILELAEKSREENEENINIKESNLPRVASLK
jgi:hypothetical protein